VSSLKTQKKYQRSMSEKGESPMEHVDEMRRHHGAQSMPTQNFLCIQLQRAERALAGQERSRRRRARARCAFRVTHVRITLLLSSIIPKQRLKHY
jgi:hypothetical protein